jgi:hypothetical protein
MQTIAELRETYKPRKISCLLIAESPPRSDEPEPRFFYNPNQTRYDFLFRSIMAIVFPGFIDDRQATKHDYLKRFCKAGFYLIDATDTPINDLSKSGRNRIILSEIESKLQEISGLVSIDTPIFLIKKNIFEIFYPKLTNRGYNIAHDEYLPYPSSGQQNIFKTKFRYFLDRLTF